MKYNKLVRDNIPEIIQQNGKKCKFRIADYAEYKQMLLDKLNEEVQEFLANPSVEELADVQEIVDAISSCNAWDLYGAGLEKYRTKGSFYNRYILEEVED